jgi:hypothetical protein
MRSLVALALLLCLAPVASAEDDRIQIIEKWYAALTAVDRATFGALISDKAVIKLEDIGIEQTKAEFIESLDEWEDAMKGATIRHQIIEESGDKVSVRVCYKFSDNESLNREDFKIEADMIVESLQAKIADSCAGFSE